MTMVYCFSGSGHSMAVAKVLAGLLECEVENICFDSEPSAAVTAAAVVFPVYCQNIPAVVKAFLKKLKAKHVALIATYGKISYGNVLWEAQRIVHGEIIAGACIPIGHTFLDGDDTFDADFLLPIAQRIKVPQKVVLPKTFKNPLADIFPDLRSRIGVKISRDDHCTLCGLCEKACPMGAIREGLPDSRCIRCLHCVTVCPERALHYQNSRVLDIYLKHYYKEEYVLFL